MSKERYFELYRQFLDQSISKGDFEDLMEWVSNEKNDISLKKYMKALWSVEGWESDEKPLDWEVFRQQLQNGLLEERTARKTSITTSSAKISRLWWYGATGVLLILIGLAIYVFTQPKVMLYSTAYGETKDVFLEDGSKVTLNANSKLEWKTDWKRSGNRYVKLDGEAYFDVKHTSSNGGFTVETNDLKVHVLGTTFNVSSRRDKTDVTLETGKIQLDLKKSGESALSMEPGDFVRYSSVVNVLEKAKVKTISESANWLDGVLWFEDVTVEEMFEEIEDQYGKRLVSTDRNLLSRRMFTGIPFEDWKVAKEALELALGVRIEERNNELYIK